MVHTNAKGLGQIILIILFLIFFLEGAIIWDISFYSFTSPFVFPALPILNVKNRMNIFIQAVLHIW